MTSNPRIASDRFPDASSDTEPADWHITLPNSIDHGELPPFDSRESLGQSGKSASISSPISATGKRKRESDTIRPLNKALKREQSQGSSEFLANAGESGRPMLDTGVIKVAQIDSEEDFMQSIRSLVPDTNVFGYMDLPVSLCVPCNVREFMEKQFDGSNSSLGRVIVLSGTATRGQATTCRDYIYSNWPLRGPWVLDMLQDAFDGAGRIVKGDNSDKEIWDMAIETTSVIVVDFVGSQEAVVDILQLVVWFGAAFQVSSDRLQYSRSNVRVYRNDLSTDFTVDYEKSLVIEESCWLALFKNPVIVQGFPVPERSNSERGLELPIELMAALGGGRHAVDFEGGLVIKGHSIAFVPVEQYEDTIQWHMISNSDGSRLRYSDLRRPRTSREQVNFESIRTKRAILGWSQVAQTLLGTACLNYNSIDWSEAKEAGKSARLSGGGLGFQSNVIGQLDFKLGAKDGWLFSSQNGPFVKIVDLAEKIPVVLYDHRARRAWLVPALDVILHIMHTRSCINLCNSDSSKTSISYSDETSKISDRAARRAIMASKDQQLYECTLPGEKGYYVRDAILDIWSLLERMMERDAVITSTPGVAIQGTWQNKLYGWEFRALVEDKSRFRRKEQVLEKTSGGWVNLVDDTDTIVLFGDGFQEVIKPVDCSSALCSAWTVLPKGRDYLAVGCPMLETLYNEAGSRRTRSYLTSRHLQWHRGSNLFERCENISGCACDRLQQLVYESRMTFGRVKPPDELPENGCVIFGRARHPMMPAKGTSGKQRSLYSLPNNPLPAELSTPVAVTSLELQPAMDRTSDGDDLSSASDSPPTPFIDCESENEFLQGILEETS